MVAVYNNFLMQTARGLSDNNINKVNFAMYWYNLNIDLMIVLTAILRKLWKPIVSFDYGIIHFPQAVQQPSTSSPPRALVGSNNGSSPGRWGKCLNYFFKVKVSKLEYIPYCVCVYFCGKFHGSARRVRVIAFIILIFCRLCLNVLCFITVSNRGFVLPFDALSFLLRNKHKSLWQCCFTAIFSDKEENE